jgi:L-threonylcarbamoyladenylate synthase
MIEEVTKLELSYDATDIRVSGSLDSHYSPVAQVLLDIEPQPGDGYIALSHCETPEGVKRLASPKNDDEFARQLYAALRSADTQNLARVVVKQPEGSGITIAIRDRLQRASNAR